MGKNNAGRDLTPTGGARYIVAYSMDCADE